MKNDSLKGQHRINEQIRAKEVRIVGDEVEPKVYPIAQALKMADGPQGLGTHGKSTAYPATITLAATWNENLAYEYGKALGRD